MFSISGFSLYGAARFGPDRLERCGDSNARTYRSHHDPAAKISGDYPLLITGWIYNALDPA
jgi:hypothetical protein